MRVAVAMSGGVDSSVAAALLVRQGHSVIGVTMRLWEGKDAAGVCCSVEAAEDARRVCRTLDIPHYVFNLASEFGRLVVDHFVTEYLAGFTPNPCLECNRHIKFDVLWRRLAGAGLEFLATGHYVRVGFDGGRYTLRRGADRGKDQSYVLYTLTQEQMARLVCPLGDLTKETVRGLAREWGLPVADKAESQDICFVGGGDYREFIRGRLNGPVATGPFLDREGRVLGRHRGIPYYTVGQRRGLGLPGKERLYVTGLDPARNAVLVGPEEEILGRCLVADGLNFVSLEPPRDSAGALVQVRYRAAPSRAVLLPAGADELKIGFAAGQRGIAPGQAAVFYRGDYVWGGGRIKARIL
ncbi:MAG: tRNA 2-thiouridine(34) synthase MnmA [Peptococcaceae bacterium]|jgi:tRNA-specific 2-thiouridylase|nr:tRNA 2-thiouridine(34) synthase MnmA [Peptococcaceae bacterium]